MLVEVGDEVKAGDDLIEIDPTETRAELETAQEELTQAQSAVTAAQTELSQAQSVLSNAQSKLSRQNITAPFSGKLIPTDEGTTYRVGQQVNEGEVIGYMIDDSKMNLTLSFSSAYVGSIKSGQSATVSIPSAMSEVSGTVSSVDTTLACHGRWRSGVPRNHFGQQCVRYLNQGHDGNGNGFSGQRRHSPIPLTRAR